PSLSFPPSATIPALTNPSLAAAFMTANRLGPSFTPPYHRVTTTMASHSSITCIRCSRREPAAVSPSSSQSWYATAAPPLSLLLVVLLALAVEVGVEVVVAVVVLLSPRMRHALMLCVALRMRLSDARRCER